jgi:serine/threonine-protein kinase
METDIKRLGHYRIVSLLGQTDLGPIYKAFDTMAERFVAIRAVRRDRIFDWRGTLEFARFRNEAQGAGQLYHPNIVAVHAYGEEGNWAYVVMDMVDGRTLAQIFRRGDIITLPTALQWTAHLLAGLSFAHQHNVVHGGVNPLEIVISYNGPLKVKGFWAPKVDGNELTYEKVPADLACYLAPEQFVANPVDVRSDLYSAGAVLYHLLCSRPPFKGGHRQLRTEVTTMAPVPPVEVNLMIKRRLQEVVLTALEKRPQDRFQSADEFLRALEEAAKGQIDGLARPTLLPDEPSAPVTPPQAEPVIPAPVEPAPTSADLEDPTATVARRRAPNIDRRPIPVGHVIFNEGEVGEEAFIIDSGMVQIYKTGPSGEKIVLASLGRGEIFGEMALVDNQPRMAAAAALENTVLVVIPRSDFQSRLDRTDKVTHKLIGVLVNRCRNLADEVKSLTMLIDYR